MTIPIKLGGTGVTTLAELQALTATGSFGVSLDSFPGATDDDKLAAACASLPNGGRVFQANRVHNYNNLTLTKGVHLFGCSPTPPFPGTNQAMDLSGLKWTRIAVGKTISLAAGSGLHEMSICPAGMTFPQLGSSSWAGTAITPTGDQFTLQNLFVVGFDLALRANTQSRYIINNFFFDCNNGLYLQENYDTARIYGVHGWPFTTINTYAASTGSDPAGKDPRSSYRTGTGLHLVGNADDTQIDGAIFVGYQTGVWFDGAVGARITRVWSECFGLPDTNGVRYTGGTENNYIADLELWNCANPILMNAGAGNQNNIGHIWIEKPGNHAINILGGNLSFTRAVVRGLKAGQACISISGANSATTTVDGFLIDQSNGQTQSAVIVPTLFPAAQIRNLRIESPYRGAGGSLFGGNTMVSSYILSAPTLNLIGGIDSYKISAPAGGPSAMTGGYHGRRVTLTFNVADTVYYTGATSSSLQGPSGIAQRSVVPGTIVQYIYDAEFGSWREFSFSDAGAVPPWSTFAAPLTMSANTGTPTHTYTARYFRNGRDVKVYYKYSITAVNGATGVILVNLPPGLPALDGFTVLAGSEFVATGKMLVARGYQGSTTQLAVVYYDNATGPLAAGAMFSFMGVYETSAP